MRPIRQLCQAGQKPRHGFAATRWRDQQLARRGGAIQHVLLVRMDGPSASVEPAVDLKGKGARHAP